MTNELVRMKDWQRSGLPQTKTLKGPNFYKRLYCTMINDKVRQGFMPHMSVWYELLVSSRVNGVQRVNKGLKRLSEESKTVKYSNNWIILDVKLCYPKSKSNNRRYFSFPLFLAFEESTLSSVR